MLSRRAGKTRHGKEEFACGYKHGQESCASRESNSEHSLGKAELYHLTTGAFLLRGLDRSLINISLGNRSCTTLLVSRLQSFWRVSYIHVRDPLRTRRCPFSVLSHSKRPTVNYLKTWRISALPRRGRRRRTTTVSVTRARLTHRGRYSPPNTCRDRRTIPVTREGPCARSGFTRMEHVHSGPKTSVML